MGEDPKRSAGDDVAASYRKAGPYLAACSQLSGSVAGLTFLGWLLDGRFKTTPWLLVAGAVTGMVLGFYLFLKVLFSIGKKKPGS